MLHDWEEGICGALVLDTSVMHGMFVYTLSQFNLHTLIQWCRKMVLQGALHLAMVRAV